MFFAAPEDTNRHEDKNLHARPLASVDYRHFFNTQIALSQGPPGRGPAREIIKITDSLYRARNGAWYSLFYVTPEGIVLVDPISTDFAAWLKGQLDQRFPGVPVRYVIYSHSHWDHIEGGAAFADTAKFVAQEGVLRNMDGRYPHMPGDMIDRNNNGQFELEEIVGPAMAHPGICGMPGNFFNPTIAITTGT